MKRNRIRPQTQMKPSWKFAGIAIALLLSLLLSSAIDFGRSLPTTAPTESPARSHLTAQQPTPPAKKSISSPLPTAAIILDGRELFKVSNSGDFSAQFRAEWINSQLKQAAQASDPVKVNIQESNQLPTILLNEQYLLTVTQQDINSGMTPAQQAEIWAGQIQQSLQKAQQERSDRFIAEAAVVAAFMLAFAIALHWLFGHLWRHYLIPGLSRLIPAIAASNSPTPKTLNVFLALTLASARTGLWLATIYNISNLFPLTRTWNYRLSTQLFATFTSPILTLGQNDYTATNLLVLVSLLVGLFIASSKLSHLLKSRILHLTGIPRGAQEAIAIVIKYTAITIGTLVVLQVWGLDISSVTILASALGVGIGFGFQDIAKNFGSALVLLFERHIQIGDFVEVGEYQGTVESIGARSTIIRTLDNVSIIVPNSRFLEKEVINWSHHNPVSRLQLPVNVAYGANIQIVKETLLDAAKKHSDVLSFPPPQVGFKGFGDSSLKFNLLVWTKEPNKQYILKSDLYFTIEELFKQRQIEIPFPQQDLHLRSGNLAIALSPQMEQILLQLMQRLTKSEGDREAPPDKQD